VLGKRNYFIGYSRALDIYGLLPMAYSDLVGIVIPIEIKRHEPDEIIIKLKKGLKKLTGFTVVLSGESKKINDCLISETIIVFHKRKFGDGNYSQSADFLHS